MKDQKKPSHENWKWLPAIVVGGTFVFTLLIAVLVAFFISPESSKALSLFASFFSDLATPFVTVGAVWMAYSQLKHMKNAQDRVEQKEKDTALAQYLKQNAEDLLTDFQNIHEKSFTIFNDLLDLQKQCLSGGMPFEEATLQVVLHDDFDNKFRLIFLEMRKMYRLNNRAKELCSLACQIDSGNNLLEKEAVSKCRYQIANLISEYMEMISFVQAYAHAKQGRRDIQNICTSYMTLYDKLD